MAVALKVVAHRVLAKVVEEQREHVRERRRTAAAQMRLDLRDVHEQARQELVGGVGQQMEHAHDRRENTQLLVRVQRPGSRATQHRRLSERRQVVQQLDADLDLEVVGQQLQQMREAIETRTREPMAVRERHQNRLQPTAQQVLRQLALLRQRRFQRVVRDRHDLLRRRVQALEVHGDDAHAHRHMLLRLELGTLHRRRQQLDRHHPQLRHRQHVLVQRHAPHERLVIGVRERQRLGQHTEELLVERRQRPRQLQRVPHGINVPNLHAERQRTQRLRKDRQQQPVPLRLQQVRHRALREPREPLQRRLRRLSRHVIRTRQLGNQDANEPPQMRRRLRIHTRRATRALVVRRRTARVRLLQHLVQRRADPVDPTWRITRHVLQHVQQRTHHLQLVVGDPRLAERRTAHQHIHTEPATQPAVPVRLIAPRAERRRQRMHHRVPQTRARRRHSLTRREERMHNRQQKAHLRRVVAHARPINRMRQRFQHHERQRQQMPLRHATRARHLARDLHVQAVGIQALDKVTHPVDVVVRRRTEQAECDAPQLGPLLVVARLMHQHRRTRRKNVVRRAVVRRVRILHPQQRHVDRRQQRHAVDSAMQHQRQRRPRTTLVRQHRRLLQKAPVPPAQLAENPHRRVRVLVVAVRQRLQMRPQRRHNVLDVRLHDRIQKLLRQIVDTQLQRAQTLAHKLTRRAQRQHQRPHQLPQVRQQHTQPHRHRQTQIDKQVLLARLGRVQQQVELLQQHRQQRQHILVQQLKAPATDAAEQRTQQQKVVRRLLGPRRALQRVHDQVRQVRLQHRLVLLREDGHRHERHLEQPQTHRRQLLVRRAQVLQARHQKLEQDLDKATRDRIVRQQVLRYAQQRRRPQDLLKQERQVRRKHLMERLGRQVNDDAREQINHVLLLTPIALRLKHAALDATDKQAAHHLAIRLRNTAVLEHSHERLEAKEQVAEQEARILHRISHMLQHRQRRLDQLGLLNLHGMLRRRVVERLLVLAVTPHLPQVLAKLMKLRQLVQKRRKDALQHRHRAIRMLHNNRLDQIQ